MSGQIKLWLDKSLNFFYYITLYFDLVYIILFLFALLVYFVFSAVRQNKKYNLLKIQSEMINNVLANFQPAKGLEKNLSNFLSLVVPLVKADGYYFYLYDQKSGNYLLKAVSSVNDGDGLIAPDYSGLVPYRKGKYTPPLGIPADRRPEKISIVKDGDVPFLEIPAGGETGLIRVGPVRTVSRRTVQLLRYLSEKLQPALEIVLEVEKMKSQVESVSASSQAIRSLTRSIFDLDGSLSTIMGLSIKIVDAAGGCFLFRSKKGMEVAVASGLERETKNLFLSDQETQLFLHKLAENGNFTVLTGESKDFYNIPPYLAAAGMEMILLQKVSGRTIDGTAVLWHNRSGVVEPHRISALQMLIRRMGDALDRQLKFKELSASYLDILKMLVSTVDNIDSHTVGHSELISNYAGIIAREMGLGDRDVKEIMLAGYLHDVGMLGLSGDILFKTEVYTDLEFETMKLHAEVGASIIESTISNSRIASYIRHHHERWDGFGYPLGLKGENIPLGARILAAADMFNAKLTGRKYREPATFERAVYDLSAVSGTQLDPRTVELLIGWFRKKQANPARRGRSLGACHEMRCCPANISKHCPAFKRTDVNCWEVEGTNCAAHGNICASCLVYTEFVYRTGKTVSFKSGA
ncbi:MAG TPA: HD domain-containing protein [Bacillota bacterium]|nr:HD domain-containing protein [Bacillota bacterium]